MQTYRFPARAVRVMPAFFAFLAVVLGASGASSQPATAADSPTYEYAVKYICGRAVNAHGNPSPVVPGYYLTAINVHFPGPVASHLFRKKFVVALPNEKQGGFISPWHEAILNNDEAFEIDCPDILRNAHPPAHQCRSTPKDSSSFGLRASWTLSPCIRPAPHQPGRS